MFDRRLIQHFNWGLFWLTVILGAVGALTLYSAVSAGPGFDQKTYYLKQLAWFSVGLCLMIAMVTFNYKLLEKWAYVIYIVCIGLLLYVVFFGNFVAGSRRWINIGSLFSVQPSEAMKLSAVICLSLYYSRRVGVNGLTLRDLFQPVILIGIPFALIMAQPDLGTALLIALVAGSITLFAKIERRSLYAIIATGMIIFPMVWFLLKEYQKQRILTFLDPGRDPLGAGYHIIQSKIAIGSGMLAGKGFLHGTQNALSFLPEQHTDFIFCVLAEEWGFLGSGIVLLLFLLLVVVGLSIAHSCREPFGIFLSLGITAMIFWEIFINTGMIMGLMPVVGVPLPFISYGGSSLVMKMVCIGLLLNISMRRFVIAT
jgi:rod shape determining protein RodA